MRGQLLTALWRLVRFLIVRDGIQGKKCMDAHQSRPGSFDKVIALLENAQPESCCQKLSAHPADPLQLSTRALRRAHLALCAQCRGFRRMRAERHFTSTGCEHPRRRYDFPPAPSAGHTSRSALSVAAFAACRQNVISPPLDASIRGGAMTFHPRPAQCSRKKDNPGVVLKETI